MEKVIGIYKDYYKVVELSSKKFDIIFNIGKYTISLDNFKYYEEMSDETLAFSADLLINGNNIGKCRNEGRGGCASYYITNTDLKSDIGEIENILRNTKSYCFSFNLSLYDIIDNIAYDKMLLESNNVKTTQKAQILFKHLKEEADYFKKLATIHCN